jgi:Zn finger protein HypA/HybF involved in hydrogenase expression
MMTEGKTMDTVKADWDGFFAMSQDKQREFVKQCNEKVTLQCNECGNKRKVSPDGNFNDRCPKCGGVDWDIL